MNLRAFHIQPQDNVATLLDGGSGLVAVFGASAQEVGLRQPIERGHKVALRDIPAGAAVLKYGVRIGHATQPIQAGDWVHLHNLASDLDERSGSLDLHSGAPTDTAAAYV
jgi:hypothetical protein